MQILDILREGETAVTDIVNRSDVQQSGVSRHLGILRQAGLVSVRRDGQRRLYSLRPEPFEELGDWIESYRAAWQEKLDRFEEELARRAAEKKDGK